MKPNPDLPEGPAPRHEARLAGGAIDADPHQSQAIGHLQRLHQELLGGPVNGPQPPRSGLGRLWGRRRTARQHKVKGVYLWGGVGRGKTYLLDTFHDSLPAGWGHRIHFHRFMQQVHRHLREIRDRQDPLRLIAADWADQYRVLCLDEFIVTDITDAMILGGLLEALLGHGVTLVTTSNIAPADLYRDGLQRARFLPAIALLEQHLEVVELQGETDHRLRHLESAEVYHVPADRAADALMAQTFSMLAPAEEEAEAELELGGRTLNTLRLADDVVWFTFRELCDGPRGTADYIEIARCFHTVLLSEVPVMDRMQEDQARRFVHLVDEFYDRNVKLIVTAAAPAESLYQGARLNFEFQRTVSRLREMRSHDYLARPHLA